MAARCKRCAVAGHQTLSITARTIDPEHMAPLSHCASALSAVCTSSTHRVEKMSKPPARVVHRRSWSAVGEMQVSSSRCRKRRALDEDFEWALVPDGSKRRAEGAARGSVGDERRFQSVPHQSAYQVQRACRLHSFVGSLHALHGALQSNIV